jgi:hypothetical protein
MVYVEPSYSTKCLSWFVSSVSCLDTTRIKVYVVWFVSSVSVLCHQFLVDETCMVYVSSKIDTKQELDKN